MGGFNFDPNRPIYLQIVEEIKKWAVRGKYPPGAKLPSVREMALDMGVNPNTMARAYSELERENFLFTRRGQGSFVTEMPDTIDRERERLTDGAVARFVTEIRDLVPDAEQRTCVLERTRRELT